MQPPRTVRRSQLARIAGECQFMRRIGNPRTCLIICCFSLSACQTVSGQSHKPAESGRLRVLQSRGSAARGWPTGRARLLGCGGAGNVPPRRTSDFRRADCHEQRTAGTPPSSGLSRGRPRGKHHRNRQDTRQDRALGGERRSPAAPTSPKPAGPSRWTSNKTALASPYRHTAQLVPCPPRIGAFVDHWTAEPMQFQRIG